jgi:hypothetical protein
MYKLNEGRRHMGDSRSSAVLCGLTLSMSPDTSSLSLRAISISPSASKNATMAAKEVRVGLLDPLVSIVRVFTSADCNRDLFFRRLSTSLDIRIVDMLWLKLIAQSRSQRKYSIKYACTYPVATALSSCGAICHYSMPSYIKAVRTSNIPRREPN